MSVRVDASAENVHWGYFDAGLPPIVTIDSGDVVTIGTVSGPPEMLPPPPFQIPPALFAIHQAKTKRMLLRAFETQLAGGGFSFVEILTMCPTGWFIETQEAPAYLEAELGSVHRIGVVKDRHG